MKRISIYITLSFLIFADAAQAQLGESLILSAEEERTLEPGIYSFQRVELGEGATLKLKGSTNIATNSLVTASQSAIVYERDNKGDPDTVAVVAADASGMRFLYIESNGVDAPDQQGRAATGGNGRNARAPFHSRSDWDGRSAHSGGTGAPGTSGIPGGNAANVSLHLPNVRPGSTLRIHANGGDGGRGQQGGAGGKGGEGATGRPAKRGGNGGSGGVGGNGGAAGKIFVYLMVDDEHTDADVDEAMRSLRVQVQNAGGVAGQGGPGGPGGPGGAGAPLGGDGSSGSGGSLGPGAPAGEAGDGPGRDESEWTTIDVLTKTQHARHLTYVLSLYESENRED